MKPLLPSERCEKIRKGVSLRLVEMAAARGIHLVLVFRDGAQGDPRGKAGLTNLAVRMLLEGPSRRNGHLAAALEQLGARCAIEVRHEVSLLRFSLPRHLFARALPLIDELVFAPGCRTADFDRLKGQTIAVLEKELKDPGIIAANILNALLMRGTPHAYPAKGAPASVRSCALEEAQARQEALRRAGVEAVVCGRPNDRDLEILRAFMRKFPPAGNAVSPLKRLTPAVPGIYFHPWPGAVQSEIRLGAQGPMPGGRDWFPALLLNTVLGGKFTSRLNLNLRETHGFTYAARSFFLERRAISCFCVSAAVATPVTVPALRELFRELDGMVANPFAPQELSDAAGFLAGSFHYGLDSPSLYLQRVVEREAVGLKASYFHRYLAFLGRVPRSDFRRVPRTSFDRSRAVLVVVGAPAVRSRLRALGLPLREAEIPA